MTGETFVAMVIGPNSRTVLAMLNTEAVAHFGHDKLFMRNVHVASTFNGFTSQYVGTADFTEQDPDA